MLWPAWSWSDRAFVACAVVAVVVAYRAGSLTDSRTAWAVLLAASLAMHARLAVGAVHAVVLALLAAAALGAATARLAPALTAGGTALAAAWLIGRYRRRTRVLRVGVGVGAVALTLAALSAAPSSPLEARLRGAALVGLAGFASSLLRLALEPLFDGVFGHATRLTLSEWLDLDHPLLRELATVAPGTLQHSVNVGLLAGAAANALGADALLARVGGLYHDVGKAAAPEYFVENQAGRNPHDDLDPRESARILRRHVTDGVERVLAHGLGERIAAFVREHHGTGVMRLLEARAGAAAADDPEAFRYPGPRPRSIETGLLMIADQVEATARAAQPADLAACARVVRQTVSRIRGEGELDDCPLSDRQLARAEQALAKALHAMYHRRLAYPPARLGPPAAARV
ncbi:MAG: HDIG domain-containing metalloprotein [Vicinamibacterales bacterium]